MNINGGIWVGKNEYKKTTHTNFAEAILLKNYLKVLINMIGKETRQPIQCVPFKQQKKPLKIKQHKKLTER